MFTFPIHEIGDREFQALFYSVAALDQAAPSLLSGYLGRLLAQESNRRERLPDSDKCPISAKVCLPIGDSTGAEIVGFTKFLMGALQFIRHEENPVADFLEALVFEVQTATQRVSAAKWN